MSKIFCAKIICCKIYVNNFPWDCVGFLIPKTGYTNTLWHSLCLTHSKSNRLEWSQCLSHLKCMKIFPDPQGQLTSKSEIRSGQNLNS